MTHTPGPWTISQSTMNRKGVRAPSGYICFLTDAEEQEANARLISASPDLLEACKDACGYLTAYRDSTKGRLGTEIVKSLEEVIRKAGAS
jgi:hypothetical protein